MAFAHQPRKAICQDRGFPCSGACNHQHGAVHVLNGLALALVRCEWGRSGGRLQRRHYRLEYHPARLAPETWQTRDWLNLLAGILVDFKDSEGVAFGVQKVALPAG